MGDFNVLNTDKERHMPMIWIVAKDFWAVQKKVAELIKCRILVGHALHNDLKVSISVGWGGREGLSPCPCFHIRVSYINSLHCIWQVLLLSHPKKDIRDTSEYEPFLKWGFTASSYACIGASVCFCPFIFQFFPHWLLTGLLIWFTQNT